MLPRVIVPESLRLAKRRWRAVIAFAKKKRLRLRLVGGVRCIYIEEERAVSSNSINSIISC